MLNSMIETNVKRTIKYLVKLGAFIVTSSIF